jgi:hypothetical protein
MVFIQLKDGIVIEVLEREGGRQQTAGLGIVDKTLEDAIARVLPTLVKSVRKTVEEIHGHRDTQVKISEAEIELGLSFSIEGSLYVAKATAEGTLKLTVKFNPSESLD